MKENLHKQALIRSLLFSSLLVKEMKGAAQFDLGLLEIPTEMPEISFEQKLGHVYEDALAALFESSSEVELLAKSLQIFNDKRITLGELDYLVKHGERVLHVELAVKFYMVHYDGEVAHFPGPDPTDNWLNKLERLESHQLQMSQNDYAQKVLLENYGVENVEVEHLIYGRLFDHIAEKRRPIPRGMSENAQRSIWLYVCEWEQYFPTEENVYMVPKQLWPVPVSEFSQDLLESLRMLSVSDLKDEVTELGRCVMVHRDTWEAPVFVVPKLWPRSSN